jgi:hypothetical protein
MKKLDPSVSPALVKMADDAGYQPSVIVPSADGTPVLSGLSADGWMESTQGLFDASEAIAGELAADG